MAKQILIMAMLLVAALGYAQQADHRPAIAPPVHTVSTDGTLRIRLNGAITDWLLGANVAPLGAMAKVQVFEMDRDFKNAGLKRIGYAFAKSVSYPAVDVLGNTVQINPGSHDTTTVYVEAPAWTTLIVTGGRVERWRDKLIGNSLAVSGVSAFVPG